MATTRGGLRGKSSPPLSAHPIEPQAPLNPPPSSTISLELMIKCAERELAIRKSVYPGFVRAKRMTVFKAEDEIAAMKAIVEHLKASKP